MATGAILIVLRRGRAAEPGPRQMNGPVPPASPLSLAPRDLIVLAFLRQCVSRYLPKTGVLIKRRHLSSGPWKPLRSTYVLTISVKLFSSK